MDPRLIFDALQFLAMLAIFAGIVWLLLRREPRRNHAFRWVVLAFAGVAGLMLAISLMTLPFSEARSDDASERSVEVLH